MHKILILLLLSSTALAALPTATANPCPVRVTLVGGVCTAGESDGAASCDEGDRSGWTWANARVSPTGWSVDFFGSTTCGRWGHSSTLSAEADVGTTSVRVSWSGQEAGDVSTCSSSLRVHGEQLGNHLCALGAPPALPWGPLP